MILRLLINLFFGILSLLFSLVDFSPINDLTADLASKQIVLPDILHYVAYFFDKSQLITLLNLEIGWIEFKIGWAIILRIKSFIPFLSST